MSINTTPTPDRDQDEAQIILDALREIQNNPELKEQAEKDPESLLNRLGLSGTARHAVALGITAMLFAPVALAYPQLPATWWAS